VGILKLYILATRPQFFAAIILPVTLGASAAWHYTSHFVPGLFVLSLVAGVLYHAGINVLNDYFDHLNGSDALNRTPVTPFTGGSRMIQRGLMGPGETLLFGSVLLVAGSLVGLCLAYAVGWPLVLVGLVGLFSGIFYSAPPLFLAGRGLGELLVGLNFGVLSVAGSYYVQTGGFQWEVVLISLPLTFLIAAILYINEFPDYEADRLSGKHNMVVRLGPERARWGIVAILGGAYLSLILGTAAGSLTPVSLIALVSIWFGWKGAAGLMKEYRGGRRLVPSIKSIIWAHLSAGVLLVTANLL
jgi:1,4-dihydroxy-2-naphthoate octaprenyltransferase